MQDKKFAVVLGGITLVVAGALLFLGSQNGSKYEEARQRYDAAAGEAGGFEQSALYPKDEYRDAKHKALTDYRESIDGLREEFAPYRPGPLETITPQAFQTNLLEAQQEVAAAFAEHGIEMPDPFFLNFETYTSTLARNDATGILQYQMQALKQVLLDLAAAQPSALRNLFRPRLPEEDGTAWERNGHAARALPFEITFKGPEAAARKFISSLLASEDHFYVIRTMRVTNEKTAPPVSGDAKFEEKPGAGAGASGAAAADPFGGFVLPDEEPAAPEGDDAAAVPEPAPAPAPVDPEDDSRILSQVLGGEEIVVFLRIDLMQFLPTEELPKIP